MSLQKKLQLYISTLVGTLLVILAIVICAYIHRIYVRQIIQENTIKMDQITSQLNQIQDQVKICAAYIYSSDNINQYIQTDFTSLRPEIVTKYKCESELKVIMSLNSYVSDIIIYRSDGEVFSTNSKFEEYYRTFPDEPWFCNTLNSGRGFGFTPSHSCYQYTSYNDVISYVTEYRYPLNDKDSTPSILMLNIRIEDIRTLYENAVSGSEHFTLYNQQDDILYTNNIDPPFIQPSTLFEGERSARLSRQDNTSYLFANATDHKDLYSTLYLAKSEVLAPLRFVYIWFAFGVFLCLLFSLLLIRIFVFKITRPLLELSKAMQRVSEGNFETALNLQGNDEVSQLGKIFNQMASELKTHILNSINDEKAKRKMQIDLLVSQIQPHFIYNTLNSIICMAEEQRYKDIVSITKSIISLMQNTVKLESSDVLSTVAEELSIVDHYLNIQSFRYPNMFTLKIDAQPEALDAILPRMLVQPLVENALLHGICTTDRYGEILVCAACSEKKLYLSVTDNGKGLTKDQIDAILSGNYKRHNRNGSVGISNVMMRLELLYGDCYKFSISSEVNTGTTVSVVLPLDYNN